MEIFRTTTMLTVSLLHKIWYTRHRTFADKYICQLLWLRFGAHCDLQ